MDAPRGSVEFEGSDELQRLRRRAYGPDADIGRDAVAQARLLELEAAQRRELTPAAHAAARGPAVSERVPASKPVAGQRLASTSIPQHGPFGKSATGQHPTEGPLADSHSIDGPPDKPGWRRRRGWVILGGVIAALALIAAGAGMSQLLADWSTPVPTETATADASRDPVAQPGAPDEPAQGYVLALESVGADAVEPKDPHATLNRLDLSADELRQYTDFRGLSLWSGENRDGRACLLVADPGQGLKEGIGGAVCPADGSEPIVEVQLCGGCAAPEVFAGMPIGSIFRFVLKGDHVDVYVYLSAADASQG